jgi:hypothetical protein
MATYLEHFKMAYTQTTLEFGSAESSPTLLATASSGQLPSFC